MLARQSAVERSERGVERCDAVRVVVQCLARARETKQHGHCELIEHRHDEFVRQQREWVVVRGTGTAYMARR